jgi:tRNA 2-selenouridine synthase
MDSVESSVVGYCQSGLQQMLRPKNATVDQIPTLRFGTIIDVRTPAEFTQDHIPGSINLPVLTDDERIQIGTLHKHAPFEARRLGAALISRNVAKILEDELGSHIKSWKPLIYCWRGGLRSGSLSIVMAQVGWPVHQLLNGYKAYRSMVLQQLPLLIDRCCLRIVSAPTGSGKTHFLYALQRSGQQIIDLEGLACHRGSVLGKVPGEIQPAQRMFESKLLAVLQQLDFTRPIFIESEGVKIGSICVPMALHKKMQESKCIFMNVTVEERVRFLCVDYSFFMEDPELLISNLSYISELHSKKKMEEWNRLARAGEFSVLVTQLLDEHYDPCYHKSLRRHYPQVDSPDTLHLTVPSLLPAALDQVVIILLEQEGQHL